MQFNTAARPRQQLLFANEKAEVWIDEETRQHSLFASQRFQELDLFCKFDASAILQAPSYLTVQIDTDKHICLQPTFLQYINHSCSPNVFFDTSNGVIICLKQINRGDELTYFYPATEWTMAQPFQCSCGNSNCLGYIKGASYLSKEVLSGYHLSDFIQQQLKKNYTK